MTKAWQVYYNSVFGSIGALIAWLVLGQIDTTTWNVHLGNVFVGAGIGLFIGGSLGVVDGLFVKRSVGKTLLGVLGGALAGMVSGLVGLFLGGVVFDLIEGGLIARILGWLTFGAFLGLGQGLVNWHWKRAVYGFIGGTVAGLVGGALYELFTQVFLQQSDQAQVFLSAVGLILIGVSLGFIIPLSVTIIGGLMAQRGLVVYLNGPRKGTEIELIGRATIGSSDACDVYVPDRSVEKQQAQIEKGSKGFEILNLGNSKSFYAGQTLVHPGYSVLLANDTIIQMGEIQLRFQSW